MPGFQCLVGAQDFDDSLEEAFFMTFGREGIPGRLDLGHVGATGHTSTGATGALALDERENSGCGV